jgi:hypothetical protein
MLTATSPFSPTASRAIRINSPIGLSRQRESVSRATDGFHAEMIAQRGYAYQRIWWPMIENIEPTPEGKFLITGNFEAYNGVAAPGIAVRVQKRE